jgi:ATP-dependent DNA helicase DinG
MGRAGLESFDSVVASIPGFRSRDGQRRMADQVARTFAQTQLGKIEEALRSRKNRSPWSGRNRGGQVAGVFGARHQHRPGTWHAGADFHRHGGAAGTAGEQGFAGPGAENAGPFQICAGQGRGRFVCKLKLERLSSTGEHSEEADDLFAEEEAAQRKAGRRPKEARMQFYASMADALATGEWDGDRDSLKTPPEPEAWSPVAAEGSSCTGKHCPVFSSCTYYERRKDMVAAQVIVANHDLLLSSLGARLLPELDNCLLVLDEAHHLPQTALSQFACEMD